jgi:hypothetical protein
VQRASHVAELQQKASINAVSVAAGLVKPPGIHHGIVGAVPAICPVGQASARGVRYFRIYDSLAIAGAK